MSSGSVWAPPFTWNRINLRYRLRVDCNGDLATECSTSSHCRPLVDSLPVLGLLPSQKCSEGAFWPNGCWKSSRTWFVVSSPPFFYRFLRADTDNNPSFNGVIAHITHGSMYSFFIPTDGTDNLKLKSPFTYAAAENQIRSCWQFCSVTRHCGHPVPNALVWTYVQ
jgi:hypothetical protein